MAGKNDSLIKLKKQIKDDRFAPIYLFYGEEHFLKDHYIRSILNAVPDMGFEEFNHIILDGKSCTPNDIDDAIDSFPMMTDRKAVIIQNSGFFKSPKDEIKEYIKNRFLKLPEDTIIIFDEEQVDKRSVSYKALIKAGEAVEFSFLSDTDLVTWVIRQTLQAGIKISKESAQYFVSMCDPGLSNLNNELEKLISYGCNPIGISDINKIVSKSLQTRVFELTDYMISQNGPKALKVLQGLKTSNESAFGILYLLFSSFDKMLYARTLEKEGETYEVISKSLGVPPFIAKKYISGARNFSMEKLEDMVIQIAETDLAIKQGKIADWAAVEKYVCSAFTS